MVDDGKDEGTRMLISGAGGETRAGNQPGYIVLNWVPSDPKRVGYQIRYVSTETMVIDQSSEGKQEQQYEEEDHTIYKKRVEDSFWMRIWKNVQSLF